MPSGGVVDRLITQSVGYKLYFASFQSGDPASKLWGIMHKHMQQVSLTDLVSAGKGKKSLGSVSLSLFLPYNQPGIFKIYHLCVLSCVTKKQRLIRVSYPSTDIVHNVCHFNEECVRVLSDNKHICIHIRYIQ